ncbi:MAG: DUF1289 domain-containing protein [Alphaproteobacteria bacterium]|nr:DUF1289 domain-containing protein [Alphaproteobacteria bacterium]
MISPCIGVCKLDPRSNLCLGCRRTIDEIGRWSIMDDDQRRAVLELLPQRKL